MSDPSKTKFSTNILAIAGLITAIGGMVTILHQTTDIFSKDKEKNEEKIQFVDMQNTFQNDTKSVFNPVDHSVKNTHNVIEQTTTPVTQNHYESQPVINLSGYWIDTINEGRYLFTQTTSTSFNFQEYSFLEGVWIISAEGIGNLSGNTVHISYNTLFGMPGTFNGTLNGQTQISGRAKDMATGFEVAINLIKE
jgi:hypothetical protein